MTRWICRDCFVCCELDDHTPFSTTMANATYPDACPVRVGDFACWEPMQEGEEA